MLPMSRSRIKNLVKRIQKNPALMQRKLELEKKLAEELAVSYEDPEFSARLNQHLKEKTDNMYKTSEN